MSNALKGANNGNYGKMWVTNGTPEGNKLIPKGEVIPEGFRRGKTNKPKRN
jgi:hypothetical protein